MVDVQRKSGKIGHRVSRRVQKRLTARINSFGSRGNGKIADGMKSPGSQNRKK